MYRILDSLQKDSWKVIQIYKQKIDRQKYRDSKVDNSLYRYIFVCIKDKLMVRCVES